MTTTTDQQAELRRLRVEQLQQTAAAVHAALDQITQIAPGLDNAAEALAHKTDSLWQAAPDQCAGLALATIQTQTLAVLRAAEGVADLVAGFVSEEVQP